MKEWTNNLVPVLSYDYSSSFFSFRETSMADLFTPIAHVEELKANIQAAVCSITNMLKGTWVLDICRPTSVAHTEIDCDK